MTEPTPAPQPQQDLTAALQNLAQAVQPPPPPAPAPAAPVAPVASPVPPMAHPQVIADLDTAHDAVNPSYYARFKIQPIQFIRINELTFWQGNVIKYVCRADAKNGLEDIEKAINYLAKERAYLKGDPNWHSVDLVQETPSASTSR